MSGDSEANRKTMWSPSILLLVILTLGLIDQVQAQTCQGAMQYDQCSSNMACGCLPLVNTDNAGICAYLHVRCSELTSCAKDNRTCYRPNHLCVNHSRCHSAPTCYPTEVGLQMLCPSISSISTSQKC